MILGAPLDRTATALLERVGQRLWGFRPRLMTAIVQDQGALRALAWFAANMPRYERTLASEGAVRTHLWCTAISIGNRCAYCTYGHGLALELAFFRDRGCAFSLHERDLVALTTTDRGEGRTSLRAALVASGIAGEVGAVERLWELADGAAPVSDLDRRMTHLLEMFRVLNTCGRDRCVAPDEAHDPLNKDVALKERYRAARPDGDASS